MAKLNKTYIDKLLGKPQIKQLELADGNNLYLVITKAGKAKFKYRIRTQTKASWIAIGDYPDITLNEARKKTFEYRAMISQGINPNTTKLETKIKHITISDLANQYFKKRLPLVRTKEDSSKQFIRAVNNDIIAIIGNLKLIDVTDETIYDKLIIPKIENGSPSVARRIRNNLKLLFDFAIENRLIQQNPAIKIKTSHIYRDKPRSRHLSINEIKIFLDIMYQAQIKTQHKIALHLSLLLLTRKTELIHATWDHVDFIQQTFTIKYSKMNTQLVIPLPIQALKLFTILKKLSQESNYIFHGRSGIKKPISTTTLNWVLRPFNKAMFNNKDDYFTIHDLRRTGATILSERGYPSDYIEAALNHSKGGIKQIYQRSKFIEQRKEMLQKWADILDSLITPELLPYDKTFII